MHYEEDCGPWGGCSVLIFKSIGFTWRTETVAPTSLAQGLSGQPVPFLRLSWPLVYFFNLCFSVATWEELQTQHQVDRKTTWMQGQPVNGVIFRCLISSVISFDLQQLGLFSMAVSYCCGILSCKSPLTSVQPSEATLLLNEPFITSYLIVWLITATNQRDSYPAARLRGAKL